MHKILSRKILQNNDYICLHFSTRRNVWVRNKDREIITERLKDFITQTYPANEGKIKQRLSYEIYPLGWNKTFKEQIRRRDEYKCQLCGLPEAECFRRLDIHHIDYDKKNCNPDNLITLCKNCHAKTNYNRNYWTNYFINILRYERR